MLCSFYFISFINLPNYVSLRRVCSSLFVNSTLSLQMYSMRSALDYGGVDDEDDEDDDDDASYGAGFESAGMHDLVGGGGMTRSRQAATEAALFAALGGGVQSTGENATPPPVLQASAVKVASGRSSPSIDNARKSPWTCSVCTLINTGVASCTACGNANV